MMARADTYGFQFGYLAIRFHHGLLSSPPQQVYITAISILKYCRQSSSTVCRKIIKHGVHLQNSKAAATCKASTISLPRPHQSHPQSSSKAVEWFKITICDPKCRSDGIEYHPDPEANQISTHGCHGRNGYKHSSRDQNHKQTSRSKNERVVSLFF